MWRFIIGGLLTCAPVVSGADPHPPILDQLIADATADCASFENGVLTGQDDALSQADLTGDGAANWILDHAHLQCSSAASLFCGTGGCSLSLIVGDMATQRLAKGWSLADFPPFRVALVQVHGANCDGTNLTPCVEALVWDDAAGQFSSTLPVEPARAEE